MFLSGYRIVFFAVFMMALTMGVHSGLSADSLDDARVNESVRENASVSPAEIADREPRPTNQWMYQNVPGLEQPENTGGVGFMDRYMANLINVVMSASLSIASAVSVWVYQNRWLPHELLVYGVSGLTYGGMGLVVWYEYKGLRSRVFSR